MKNFKLPIIFIVLLFSFIACNKGKKLEKKLEGRWEVKTLELIHGTSFLVWEEDETFGTRMNVQGEGFFEITPTHLTASYSYDVVDTIGTRSRKVELFDCDITVDPLGEYIYLKLDSTDTRSNIWYITDKGFHSFEFFTDRIYGTNSFDEQVGDLFRFEMKKTK